MVGVQTRLYSLLVNWCILGAKHHGTPLLAVATEEGSVTILDTSRRADWELGTCLYVCLT